MRFTISLCIILVFITTACNLSASNSQSSLTAIPTTAALSHPTRTPMPSGEETQVTVES